MGDVVHSAYRFAESRTSQPSIEWKTLPEVGGDRARRAYRARAWRVLLIGLTVFWAGVTAVLIALVL